VADQICGLMREDSIKSNVLSFPGWAEPSFGNRAIIGRLVENKLV
jgi:hypothetical protein